MIELYGSRGAAAFGFSASAMTILIGVIIVRMVSLKAGIPMVLLGIGIGAVAYGIHIEPKHNKLMGAAMFSAAMLLPAFTIDSIGLISAPFAVISGIWAMLWQPKKSTATQEENVCEDPERDHTHH